ncbi:MAG: DMT family transporter, partial [Thermoanaerobaculia bacterium]
MPRLGALVAVALWGISFVATKTALRDISPTTQIFTRFAIGSVLHLAIVRRLPPRESWPSLALMGFIGVFVHQMLQSYALTMTSAIHTGWLIAISPIWSAILAAIFLRERFGPWKVIGLIGGTVGALIVITRGDFSPSVLRLPSTRGDLLILVSTVNWSIYSVVGHPTIRRLGPRRATSGAMLFGTLMLAPLFVIRQGWRELPNLSQGGWVAVLFLGIGCSALGYLFWYGALETVEVSRVAAFLHIEPLFTFVAAIGVLHESVSLTTVVGGLLVIVSVLLTQYARADSRNSTNNA